MNWPATSVTASRSPVRSSFSPFSATASTANTTVVTKNTAASVTATRNPVLRPRGAAGASGGGAGQVGLVVLDGRHGAQRYVPPVGRRRRATRPVETAASTAAVTATAVRAPTAVVRRRAGSRPARSRPPPEVRPRPPPCPPGPGPGTAPGPGPAAAESGGTYWAGGFSGSSSRLTRTQGPSGSMSRVRASRSNAVGPTSRRCRRPSSCSGCGAPGRSRSRGRRGGSRGRAGCRRSGRRSRSSSWVPGRGAPGCRRWIGARVSASSDRSVIELPIDERCSASTCGEAGACSRRGGRAVSVRSAKVAVSSSPAIVSCRSDSPRPSRASASSWMRTSARSGSMWLNRSDWPCAAARRTRAASACAPSGRGRPARCRRVGDPRASKSGGGLKSM